MFDKKSLYLGKSGYIRKTLLYSGISGCIRTKKVVFRKKWLYSGKSG